MRGIVEELSANISMKIKNRSSPGSYFIASAYNFRLNTYLDLKEEKHEMNRKSCQSS